MTGPLTCDAPSHHVGALAAASQRLDDLALTLTGAVTESWQGGAAERYRGTRARVVDRTQALADRVREAAAAVAAHDDARRAASQALLGAGAYAPGGTAFGAPGVLGGG